MRLLLPLLLALFPALASGQTIKLEGPDRVNAGDPVSLVGTMPEGVGENYRWAVIPKPAVPPMQLVDRDGRPVLIILKSAGRSYTILLDCQIPSDGADPWHRAEKIVTVGTPGPDPGPEPEPDPGPDPDPDDKAPFPADGLHVLIVFESVDATKLTSDQRLILYGADVRGFLNTKCAMGPDGKTRAFRIYDADSDVSGDQEVWKSAMGVERKSLPWLVVSNGKAGFSGPLNMSPEKFKEIIGGYSK